MTKSEGFIGKLLGGGSKQKIKKTVEILNTVTTNFMSKISQNINAPTMQNMNTSITAIGKGSKVIGISQDQAATVSIEAAAAISQSADLQQQLKTKLRDEIKAKTSAGSGILSTPTDVDLTQVIDNSITNNFSQEIITAVDAGINQDMQTKLAALDGGMIQDLRMSQQAEAVIKIAQDVSIGIAAKMANVTESELKATLESKSMIDSVFGGLASIVGGYVQAIALTFIVLIIFVIVVVMLMKLAKGGSSSAQYRQPQYGQPQQPQYGQPQQPQYGQPPQPQYGQPQQPQYGQQGFTQQKVNQAIEQAQEYGQQKVDEATEKAQEFAQQKKKQAQQYAQQKKKQAQQYAQRNRRPAPRRTPMRKPLSQKGRFGKLGKVTKFF